MLLLPMFLDGAKHMRYLKLFIIVSLGILLCQCASYDFRQRIVQQGNLLPASKFKRLEIGMTKKQVATLMGTSLLSPTFSKNRWDYAYTLQKGMGPMTVKHAELFFTDGILKHINYKTEKSNS
jgi:outer membrane protein assembly factor BamE